MQEKENRKTKTKRANTKQKSKTAELNPNLIITLSVNGLNTWTKRDSQSGLENMIQQYTIYKKLTSNIMI